MAEPTNSGSKNSGQENPFPGLKPYEIGQSRFYYTDEARQAEVLSRLHSQRFITLIGEPGSGKASFVNCAIIPTLLKGFAGRGGIDWSYVRFRPGNNPLKNMALALSNSKIFEGADRVEPNFAEQLENTLRENSLGLLKIFEQHPLKEGHNLFIFIDDFEDIFAFRHFYEKEEDTRLFANLIVRFIRRSKHPVYLLMALSSANLSESSLYPGLPEVINDSQYMVSKLDATRLREFLNHAFKNAEIPVEKGLISRIVTDFNANVPNHYSLQFLLHYMVEIWIANKEDDEAISEKYYEKAGGLKNAFENKAEEVYNSLDESQQGILATLLKGVTGYDKTRVTTINEIGATAKCSVGEVIEVISRLRADSLDFIQLIESYNIEEQLSSLKGSLKKQAAKLNGFTQITLRNFELVRCWPRFHSWVKEEKEQADLYLRLVNAADLYSQKERGYLTGTELRIIQDWYENKAPSKDWFRRYSERNEMALEFFKGSLKNHEKEVRMEQQKLALKARRDKQFRWVLIIAAVVSLGFSVWAYFEKIKATDATLEAKLAKQKSDREKYKMDYVQDLDSVSTLYVEELLYLDSLIDSSNDLFGNPADSCCIGHIKANLRNIGGAAVNFRMRSKASMVDVGQQKVRDSLGNIESTILRDFESLKACCIDPLKYRTTPNPKLKSGCGCWQVCDDENPPLPCH